MIADLGRLDLLMAAAWPAREVERRDGWLHRYTSGVTRRANSVLTFGEPDDLSEAIASAEAFYASRGAPSTFMVSEASAPARLPELLEARGYESSATTWMLWTDPDLATASLAPTDLWHLDATAIPTDEWFETYWMVEADRRASQSEAVTLREVLLRPDDPARFAAARARHESGSPVAAVGQMVLQDGWGCVQCLATRPTGRRRGAATAVLRHLAVEAAETGMEGIYAAVMADNEASLGLFSGASFRRSHRYSYFTRP